MTHTRTCDRCGFAIQYQAPDSYNKAGSHPLPGEPSATVQSAMSVVEIDGEAYDYCVENGCLAAYKAEEGFVDSDKKKKLRKWAEKVK